MICQGGTIPQGGAGMKMSPMLGPIVRGQHKQLVLVATVLKHKSNVGTTLVKVVFLLFILCSTHCFSIVIPVQIGSIQKHVPVARCDCCDSAHALNAS
jgi:hypothetical protein